MHRACTFYKCKSVFRGLESETPGLLTAKHRPHHLLTAFFPGLNIFVYVAAITSLLLQSNLCPSPSLTHPFSPPTKNTEASNFQNLLNQTIIKEFGNRFNSIAILIFVCSCCLCPFYSPMPMGATVMKKTQLSSSRTVTDRYCST